MTKVHEYDLPDSELLKENGPSRFLVWVPRETCIVLGNSNRVHEAVWMENVISDHVPIFVRPTGGQSVVLSPKMVVISSIHNTSHPLPSKKYFELYTGIILSGLSRLGVENLEVKGVSDITMNNLKIAGSAMYRNREKVFFHAVLNVRESPASIQRYLRYPSTTPEYRGGRDHMKFVTSLALQGYSLESQEIVHSIETRMRQIVW